MPRYVKAQRSIADILHTVGKGIPLAELDSRAHHNLEQLKAATVRFWGASEEVSLAAKCQRLQAIYFPLEAKRQQLQLADSLIETVWRVYLPLAQWVVEQSKLGSEKVFVLGVNGAQGSGKSTLCVLLQAILETGFGQRVALLSLDDFYHTRTERQRLARCVHPLLSTRGVPGTHDMVLGCQTLASLQAADKQTATPLPVFDKAIDDRIPWERWPVFQGRPNIILFEGWCVGARPEPDENLDKPVNRLEANEDPQGVWRRYVNQALAKPYSQLFSSLDALLFLKIPAFSVVYEQRLEQEQRLTQALQGDEGKAGKCAMDVQALQRFIMHFQRLTEYMLDEIPTRADLILEINEHRQFQRATKKEPSPRP